MGVRKERGRKLALANPGSKSIDTEVYAPASEVHQEKTELLKFLDRSEFLAKWYRTIAWRLEQGFTGLDEEIRQFDAESRALLASVAKKKRGAA
jgi:hypothetical protein